MTSPLVTAEELRAELASDDAPVVLDVRWYLPDPERGRREYDEAHLPGARFADLESVFSAPAREDRVGGRHPLPEVTALQESLRSLGLHDDSRVVVLDQGMNLSAARAWWVLRDAGLTDVRVLDGGMKAWLAADGETTSEVDAVAPGTVSVLTGDLDQADADEVAAHLADGGRVIDVRAADRFRGENETVDPVAGHIPGATNIPLTEYATGSGFVAEDRRRELFADLEPGDIFSCGSGVTAAQALLAAESVGLEGLRIYPGSWSDWISDPSREVATGDE